MLLDLQKIKNGYLTWNILIANEASTGLYHCQTHNRNLALKKIASNKQHLGHQEQNVILRDQMKKTHEELSDVSQLSNNWVKNMNEKLDKLSESLV